MRISDNVYFSEKLYFKKLRTCQLFFEQKPFSLKGSKQQSNMIIWLTSYPRSGNTYFRILLKHFYGINSYSLYEDKEITAYPEICKLVGHLPRCKSLVTMAQSPEFYFIKTHELPQDDSPAIYLIRDGRDVLLSYAWYSLTIENVETHVEPITLWKTLYALILDDRYFGGWGAHVLAWVRRQAPTAIVKFEDLVRTSSPSGIVRQVLKNVGYQLPEELNTSSPPTFSDLHQKMPNFFRQGQIGTWKTQMPPKLHDLFWQYHGKAMHDMGYTREISQYSDLPIEEQARLLPRYDEELTITERIIRTQKEELFAKEQVIREKEQAFQELYVLADQRLQIIRKLEASPGKLLLKRYLPTRIQSVLRQIRQQWQPQLGTFHHYRPVTLSLPTRYAAIPLVSPSPSPTVSIVTPSLNHARFLERTIESVLNQQYLTLEYIIQDGGSTDGSLQILEHYQSQLTHLESRPDCGQAHAINLGFRHASGEIMAWLNSDDILLPGTLAYVATFFHEHPEVDVVYGHRVIIDEHDQEVGRWVLPPHDENMLLWADYVPQETLFWRRQIWEKAGGYVDESYHFALDWELLLRFYDTGAKFARLPRFLSAFRVHDGQKTSRELDGNGLQEMSRLRKQRHGREISNQEALYQIRSYMRKHVLYDVLYRAGVFKILRKEKLTF